MAILNKLHIPSVDELANRPDMEPIGHEVLECPCGIELTWFDAVPVSSPDTGQAQLS